MPLAVTLELDPAARPAVVGLWESLQDIEGIETTGMLGATPHLTLGIYRDDLPQTFFGSCRRFAGSAGTIPVSFPGLTFFPGEAGTLSLAPVPTAALLRLHEAFHRAAAEFRGACDPHYRPGAWVPHVTLAQNLQGERTGRAIARLQERWQGLSGSLDSLVVLRFMPVVELDRIALRDARGAG